MKRKYHISGMTCDSCRISVENTLSKIPGVISTKVHFPENFAEIEMKALISTEAFQNSLPSKYTILPEEDWLKTNETFQANDSIIKQLFPLILILGYITIISIVMNAQNFNADNFMLDFMGIFYLVFSFFKLLDLKGFPKSFGMYDPIAKKIPFYGNIYPFIEIALGILFLTRYQIGIALIATIFILGVTTFGVARVLANKKTIQCACLGTVLKLPMTKATIIENSIMLIMALLMLIKYY